MVMGLGHSAYHAVPEHGADHPQTKGAHGQALGKRRRRPVAQRHAQHGETDDVVARVTKEVEGVSLQRRGPSRQPRTDLDHKHYRVDGQHDPKHAPIGGVAAMRIGS
jgi:hypothetical protein